VKVYDAGAAADHPAAVADGAVGDSFAVYPVTATLSVAVKVVIETERDVAVAGMLNAVTVGAVVSSVIVTDALLLVDTLPAASLAQA
jgi:hypothetical protein